MEDYGTIIWVIIIVGAMIYNVSSKARKQLKKTTQQADEHAQGEAWPSWDAESASKPQIERSEAAASVSPMQTASGKVNAKKARRKDAAAQQKPYDEPSDPALQTGDSDESAILAEITDDFDLGKAVIYSEILKPKFEE